MPSREQYDQLENLVNELGFVGLIRLLEKLCEDKAVNTHDPDCMWSGRAYILSHNIGSND
jgi:hypothetical protein